MRYHEISSVYYGSLNSQPPLGKTVQHLHDPRIEVCGRLFAAGT